MGCITLELLIWLLYGESQVVAFHNELGNGSFYQVTNNNVRNEARVHHVVTSWMDRMADDTRCRVGATAIGNLWEIVRTGLLVVKLPHRLGNTMRNLSQGNRMDSVLIIPEMEDTGVLSGGVVGGEHATTDARPAADVPSLTLSPAEPELAEVPSQPQYETRGHARFLSDDLCQRLEAISAEDEDESYWCLQEPHHSMSKGSFLSNPAPMPPTTDQQPIDRDSGTYPKAWKPHSHGLAAPNQQMVSVITVLRSGLKTTNMLCPR